MSNEELYRLNERFVKDFAVKIDVSIASSPYFKERLVQYEAFRPGTIDKYHNFIRDVESNFSSVDEFYDVRNDFIQRLISDQEERQALYGFKGNGLKEYSIENNNLRSGNAYKDTSLGKTLISIDLKSANFQSLKFFNPEIVRNCKTYEEYVSYFTTFKNFGNKRIRSTSFGKTCNKQIYKIERFLTNKVVEIILKYEPESNIFCFNSDEVVFLKTNNLDKILEEVSNLSKEIDIIFDIEEFFLRKINGIKDGYVKEITDLKTKEKRRDICNVSAKEFPFVLAALYGEHIKDSYLYFKDNDNHLCKYIEYPQVEIL